MMHDARHNFEDLNLLGLVKPEPSPGVDCRPPVSLFAPGDVADIPPPHFPFDIGAGDIVNYPLCHKNTIPFHELVANLRGATAALADVERKWVSNACADCDPAAFARQAGVVNALCDQCEALMAKVKAAADGQREAEIRGRSLCTALSIRDLFNYHPTWIMASIAIALVGLVIGGWLGSHETKGVGLLVAFGFFGAAILAYAVRFLFDWDEVEENLQALRRQFVANDQRAESLRDQEISAKAQVAQLLQKHQAELQIYEAMKYAIRLTHERNALLVAKRDYRAALDQLLLCDRAEWQDIAHHLHRENWRAMRGLDFEHYLRRVFERLGYQVTTTRASGDFGVDFVVQANSRTIAVQAKGYSGTVGVDAVQQVHTGMVHYQCQACAVVTNSTFTAPAYELARTTKCALISGGEIDWLVDGKHELFPRAVQSSF